MREIVFDTETTGLDPFGGDRIVEIAAVEIVNNVLTENKYHIYLDPQRDIPDSAYRVHGISREFLIGKPLFSDIVDDFLAFVGDDPLIAHNAEFDINFINAEMRRIGRPYIEKNQIIDTLVLARRKHPGSSNSLDALCARYEIDVSRRIKHGALIDSEILAEVYLELKVGRQKTLTFSIQRQIRKIERVGLRRSRAVGLEQFLGSEEILSHDELVAKMPDHTLWKKVAPMGSY